MRERRAAAEPVTPDGSERKKKRENRENPLKVLPGSPIKRVKDRDGRPRRVVPGADEGVKRYENIVRQ
jgi:hypothetical protein